MSTRIESDPAIEIRCWMLRQKIRPSDIAKTLDVTPSAITHFLNRRSTSERFLNELLALGCPEEYVEKFKAS